MPSITRIPAAEIDAAWPALRPLILQGLEQTARTATEALLRAGLTEGKLHLWTILDRHSPAIAITMIADYPDLRALSVVLLAGRRMSDWLGLLEAQLDAFGREQGCTELEALVRPGLAGARYRPAHAKLKNWRAEKTLMRRMIPTD